MPTHLLSVMGSPVTALTLELAGMLAQDTMAITGQKRSDMLALATQMKLEGDLVHRAVAACRTQAARSDAE